MKETAIGANFRFKKAVDEVSPEIEQLEDEDTIIARLSTYPEWQALRSRLERRIETMKQTTKISKETVGEIDDFEIWGFKCALADLNIEVLQGVIDDVELTAKILKQNKDVESGTTK
jgi:hypothetical protein